MTEFKYKTTLIKRSLEVAKLTEILERQNLTIVRQIKNNNSNESIDRQNLTSKYLKCESGKEKKMLPKTSEYRFSPEDSDVDSNDSALDSSCCRNKDSPELNNPINTIHNGDSIDKENIVPTSPPTYPPPVAFTQHDPEFTGYICSQTDGSEFDSTHSVLFSDSDDQSELSDQSVIRPVLSSFGEEYSEMLPDSRHEMGEEEQAENEEKRKRKELNEKAKQLRDELSALNVGSKPLILPPMCKGKPLCPRNIPNTEEMPKDVMFNVDDIDLETIRSEVLKNMNEKEVVQVVQAFLESNPRIKYKENYPFMTEGMIQKDYQKKDLKVFSSRIGSIKIPDTRPLNDPNADYVYFMVLEKGVYKGFHYGTHPSCLISAKFKSINETLFNAYAILTHPFGPREETLKEELWTCWNDSLGAMRVHKRSAQNTMKKQPGWDKQLDIVSINTIYQGGFFVNKISVLTNYKDKEKHFPEEVFLIEDAVFKETHYNNYIFYSDTLKSDISIAKDRIGTASDKDPFEMVVAATFLFPTKMEFRCLLIIPNPDAFWNNNRQWIRERLSARTDAYRK